MGELYNKARVAPADLAKTRGNPPAIRQQRVGYPTALIHKVSERHAQPPQHMGGPSLPVAHNPLYPRRYQGSYAARQSKNITAVKK